MEGGMTSILAIFGAILVILILVALFRRLIYYLPELNYGKPPHKHKPPPRKNVKVVVVEKLKKLFN